jgi:hypothetical protein
MIWYPIGGSEPQAFYKAMLDLVLSARIALFMAAALFVAGVAAVQLHHHLMVAGLLLFYHAVMYVQLPGFINAVPNRAATWLLFAFLLLGTATSPLAGFSAYLPYALLLAALYGRRLWGKPTYYPNLVIVAGLLLLPLSATPLEAVLSFPLASVYALMYRIDFSRAKKKFTVATATAVAAAYVAAFFAAKAGHPWAVAVPSLLLTAFARPRLNDAYGVSAFFFRWAVALAPIGHHWVYMAFAVIMSGLCVPFFVPSILFRDTPRYQGELISVAAVAYALRNIGLLTPAAALVVALVLYVAWRSLRERYYPPGPPPASPSTPRGI